MKLIIAGCRWIDDYNIVADAVASLYAMWDKDTIYYDWHNRSDLEIVQGGCRGVDSFARLFTYKNKLHHSEFKADWHTYGKAAGPIRNKEMAEYADWLLAIWDYNSRGTQSMIVEMAKLNKPIYVYYVAKPPKELCHEKAKAEETQGC